MKWYILLWDGKKSIRKDLGKGENIKIHTSNSHKRMKNQERVIKNKKKHLDLKSQHT